LRRTAPASLLCGPSAGFEDWRPSGGNSCRRRRTRRGFCRGRPRESRERPTRRSLGPKVAAATCTACWARGTAWLIWPCLRSCSACWESWPSGFLGGGERRSEEKQSDGGELHWGFWYIRRLRGNVKGREQLGAGSRELGARGSWEQTFVRIVPLPPPPCTNHTRAQGF